MLIDVRGIGPVIIITTQLEGTDRHNNIIVMHSYYHINQLQLHIVEPL